MKTARLLFLFFIAFGGALPALAQGTWWDTLGAALNSANQQRPTVGALSNTDIAAGLREALRIGTDTVVKNLGRQGGFSLDPKIHIPLPGVLRPVDTALNKVGMGFLTDDLETRMNRAAELATPKAKKLFVDSIQQMTLNDAKTILTGPKDAATQYLRRTMGPGLSKEMQPLVKQALAESGAVTAYDSVIGQYDQLPFMPDVKTNLNNYVVGKALDGIFYYVAQEEAAIRQNPAKRTTELLRKVFGGKG